MKNLSKTTQVLVVAKELIKDSRRWNKGCYAKSDEGYNIPCIKLSDISDDSDVISWDNRYDNIVATMCIKGAIYRSAYINTYEYVMGKELDSVIQYVSKEYGCSYVADFNDDPETTHEDVMKFMDRCIEISMERDNELQK